MFYDTTLAILYAVLFILIVSYIRSMISQHRKHFEQNLKREEDEIERFIDELYAWGKRNSNLVNQD